MKQLSALYGRILDALALTACAILFAVILITCADVLLRNLFASGIAWTNETSEYALYLMTMLTVPWLLRQGAHVRVDLLLQAVSARNGWRLEWFVDLSGLLISLVLMVYGVRIALESAERGSLVIKTLVFPEWWLLVPLPVAFALLAAEFVFRMQRLYEGERVPRKDAVSAS